MSTTSALVCTSCTCGVQQNGAICLLLRCDRGYELFHGDRVRMCQANGQWSGTAPTCKSKLMMNLCLW